MSILLRNSKVLSSIKYTRNLLPREKSNSSRADTGTGLSVSVSEKFALEMMSGFTLNFLFIVARSLQCCPCYKCIHLSQIFRPIVAMGFLNGVSKPCQKQCGWTLGHTAAISQGQEEMEVSLVDWRAVLSLEEKTQRLAIDTLLGSTRDRFTWLD